MNDPMTAWVLQVYLRDRGFYLWLAPSAAVYGGFQARVERYDMFHGLTPIARADAETIQDAARQAAEQVCDLSGFEAWRAEWEEKAGR
jgi:hypothetical protein